MSQQVEGTTRKISDSSCSQAYTNSLKCLDQNKYDKAKCKDAFEAYKKCNKEQFEADRQERIANRKGFFGPAWHHHLQQRGYAINKSWKARRKDVMPDRNLPARNEQIRAREVRVIFPIEEDKVAEVLPTRTAISMARDRGLDLVMVSPRAEPPVARLVEWSKVLYEQQKREKAATKAKLAQQRAAVAREVRIGCQIAEHDLEVKMAQARRFLEDGSPLRLVVTFKGAKQVELARNVTLYLIGQLTELCGIKDEKHLQKPLRNQWAVVLTPTAAPPIPVKPHANKQQQQQQQQHDKQQEQGETAPSDEKPPPAATTAAADSVAPPP